MDLEKKVRLSEKAQVVFLGLLTLSLLAGIASFIHLKIDELQTQAIETQYLIQNLKAGVDLQVEKELQIRKFRNYILEVNKEIDPQFAFELAELNYKYAIKYPNIDPYLVVSMQSVESKFNIEAVSPKGALGIFQIMPVNLRLICRSKDWEYSKNFHTKNLDRYIESGYIYLDILMSEHSGDDVLIAWNAGSRWVGEKTLPKETVNFVKRVKTSYKTLVDFPI